MFVCSRSGRALVGAWLLLCGCDDTRPADAPPSNVVVPPAPPKASAQPDVVLVSIDSLRADHLGAYGYPHPTSPVFDRLAASGVRFEWAISTTSWTLPAHAALFTGLYDSAHGLVDNGLRMADAHLTLAEVLRDQGYRTAGFFGGPYLHPTYGLGQGFDVYESCMSREASGNELQSGNLGFARHDVTGPRTLEAVSRWLADVNERPFFLFVHLWDVHYDYIAPPEYVRLFDPDYAGTLDARDLLKNTSVHSGMPARDREHLIALYDAEIRFTDEILGRLLDALEASGRLGDTLVVVTADHGEEFFEHGGKGHGRTLYDEVVRVPLVFAWPGRLPAGRIVPEPVRLIDVMPTVLALAGAPPAPHAQGRDLAPLWRGEPTPSEPALTELLVDGSLRALRTARYKWFEPGPARLALVFDLATDPGEQRPQEPVGALQRGPARLRHEVSAALARRRDIGGDPVSVAVDPSLWQQLRALGYVDGAQPDAAGEEAAGSAGP